MPRYLATQIEEIRSYKSLRIYGTLLCIGHLLSLAWWVSTPSWRWMLGNVSVICWPWLPHCSQFRVYGENELFAAFVVYGVGALTTAAFFFFPRRVAWAWWGLLALEILKLLFLSVDYRLRMNQHYMSAWVAVVFLFFPAKAFHLRLLIVLFYFWAGVLKFNSEWLSGAALYGRIWFFHGTDLLKWACAYVLLLEIVLVWGLWLKRKFLFWATFGQLIVFHVISFSVVGFFYPLLMFFLLSIFPLHVKDTGMSLGELFVKGRVGKLGYGLVALFSLLQLWHHSMPGDTALTGEGRHFGLHMFDARVECRMSAEIEFSREMHKVDLSVPAPTRTRCDPIIAWNRARELCRILKSNSEFRDLRVRMESKRSSSSSYTRIIDLSDFCLKNPDYSMLRHNSWIDTNHSNKNR
jgi:hypothetical protein